MIAIINFSLALGIDVMNKRIVFLVLAGLLLPANAMAQSAASDNAISSNASALLTRQQQRMDILEQGLKEIRGVIEQDLREIKLKVEQLGSSSAQAGTAQVADLNALRNEMEKLNDTLAMTSRRMERTLEITSDTEFRLLRLEKRVQTLISLGGSELASAAAQQETTAADAPANVQMTRESNSGVTKWSVEEGALNRELETLDAANTPDAAAAKDGVETANNSALPADNAVSGAASNLNADAAANDAPATFLRRLPNLRFCLRLAPKSNIALRLGGPCKMIWKQPNWPLPNFGPSTKAMNARPMPLSGWDGCSSCAVNMRRPR